MKTSLLSIQQLLHEIRMKFSTEKISSYEVELILCRVSGISRASLKARPEQLIEQKIEKTVLDYCMRRANGEPIAYLFKEREFWGLPLYVDNNVLIPRHETELIIEYCIETYAKDNALKCLDLGTGSGAIALALGKAFNAWNIVATDQCANALGIAQKNAGKLNITNVNFIRSSWFSELEKYRFDLIISNPPYIAKKDIHLKQGDLRYEPYQALASDDNGLKDLSEIIKDAHQYLISGGVLILEHGFEQGEAVRNILSANKFSNIKTHRDYSNLERFTTARFIKLN